MSATSAMPRRIPLWRQPDLRRLTLARLISRTGGEAAFFVGIWGRAAYEFDATPSELAVMMAILGITAMLGSATAGVLVDRFGPRRVMLVGEAVFAPAALAMLLPTSMGQMNIVVGVLGFLTMIVVTTVSAFPPFLARNSDELVRANSLVEASGTIGFIAGPAIGAVLAATVGIDWIFVFDAVTSLIAVVIAARITLRPQSAARDHAALRDVLDGVRFAASRPTLRFLLVLGSVSWLAFGAFAALEPLFFRDVLGTGPEALGWINTVFGVGLVAGTAVLNRLPSGWVTTKAGVLLTAASGVGAFVYTGTTYLPVVVLGGLYWGFVLGMLFPVLRSLIQLLTPLRLQGRVSSLLEMTHNLGELVPLAFVPALAAAFGVQQVLVSSGGLLVVLAALCLPLAARLDRGLPAAKELAQLHVDDASPAPGAQAAPTSVGVPEADVDSGDDEVERDAGHGREAEAGVVQ